LSMPSMPTAVAQAPSNEIDAAAALLGLCSNSSSASSDSSAPASPSQTSPTPQEPRETPKPSPPAAPEPLKPGQSTGLPPATACVHAPVPIQSAFQQVLAGNVASHLPAAPYIASPTSLAQAHEALRSVLAAAPAMPAASAMPFAYAPHAALAPSFLQTTPYPAVAPPIRPSVYGNTPLLSHMAQSSLILPSGGDILANRQAALAANPRPPLEVAKPASAKPETLTRRQKAQGGKFSWVTFQGPEDSGNHPNLEGKIAGAVPGKKVRGHASFAWKKITKPPLVSGRAKKVS